VVLQWCPSGVTVVLQWCYNSVAVVLQWCYLRPHGQQVAVEGHAIVGQQVAEAAAQRGQVRDQAPGLVGYAVPDSDCIVVSQWCYSGVAVVLQ
jgi:hypothetical protein